MPKAVRYLMAAFIACAALPVGAQSLGAPQKLAYLLPTLYGPNGLFVDSEAPLPGGGTHSAHFNSSFQQSFGPFNSAIATQLAAVPLPAPASGFTYTYDAALGVFNRSTSSYGPILSERAETLGKNRVSLSVNYQRFGFDTIDGLSLDTIPAVFTHDNPVAGTGRDDLVTTDNSIGITLSQFTTFFNYGLSDRVDVAIAIPIVSVDMNVRSLATVQRIGTTNPATHFYFQPFVALQSEAYGTQQTFTKSGSASGIGDILLRLKLQAVKKPSFGISLGLDGRAPTGDELNMLGSGAPGLRPFLVVSTSHKTVSPHLKLGYQWNGDSLLAGNILAGTKGDLADQGIFEAGVDIACGKKLTLALDFLGQRVIDGERLSTDTFRALNGTSTFPNIKLSKGSYNVADGSVGLKANPGGNLLIDLNLVFKLNDTGLRARVTPLFGIEYSF